MTPPPENKNGLMKYVLPLVLVVIIGIAIAVIVLRPLPFFPEKSAATPALPQVLPQESTISPSRGAYGTLVPVTLRGTDVPYGPSPSVWLSRAGEQDIIAGDVAVLSPAQITCTFPLPASKSSTGSWDVYIKVAGQPSAVKIGVFTVTDERSPPLVWNWSADGWGDWQHSASCPGTTGTEPGSCLEYGPVIENGRGVHGSQVTFDRVATESNVWKTFTSPSGTRWDTLTFTGRLSASAVPSARWIAIEVNNVRVFYADATQMPPGNGQQFTITQTIPPADRALIRISSGQDPTWETTEYTLQFDTLQLS